MSSKTTKIYCAVVAALVLVGLLLAMLFPGQTLIVAVVALCTLILSLAGLYFYNRKKPK